MEKEIRIIEGEQAELRLLGETGRTVEGYGIVFNSPSSLIGTRDGKGFIEVIKPEAGEGIIENNDIGSYLNHNQNKGILARSLRGEGSLRLSVDGKGVKYSFEAPNFDLGDELIEGIKRGDIRGSSFGFIVDPKDAKLERRADGVWVRSITKFSGVFDISPVYTGAYPDASVALRSLEEVEKQEELEIAQRAEEEAKLAAEKTVVEPIVEPYVQSEEERFLQIKNDYLQLNNY